MARWGGLAGILAALVATAGLVLLSNVAPRPPVGLDLSVADFPAERAVATLGEALVLAAYVLLVVHLLALHRSLKGGDLAPVLFGGGLGLVGLALLLAGGIPAVAFGHLSDVFHTPGATAQDQATLIIVSQGVQAILNETDTVGGLLLTAGFLLLGAGMVRHPRFGPRYGTITMGLGLAALLGILFISIAQGNPDDAAFVIPIVVLPLVQGSKLIRLSLSPA